MENSKIKILRFLRQNRQFAISLDSLVGIFYDAQPNLLPNIGSAQQHPVIGIIGYEGKPIPVIDLTNDGDKPNDKSLILIIQTQANQEFGILTDVVEDILECNKEEIISEGPIALIDPIGLAYRLNSQGWFNKKEENYANHKNEK